MIGHTITIASKMIRLVNPRHIVIGENAHKQLTESHTVRFISAGSEVNWDYNDPVTGKIYPVFCSGDKSRFHLLIRLNQDKNFQYFY